MNKLLWILIILFFVSGCDRFRKATEKGSSPVDTGQNDSDTTDPDSTDTENETANFKDFIL